MNPYQLHHSGTMILQHLPEGVTRYIPVDRTNNFYLEFLAWDEIPGNHPDPADPLPPRTLAQRRETKLNIAKPRQVKDTL
jgi:hypothetical protein